jgi:hypothetical protein
MAKLMWMMISFTLGIRGPANMFHFFDPCLEVFQKKQRNQVLIGVAVFCWALWLSSTFWIRSWSLLSKEEEHSIFYGRMSLVRDNGVGVVQQEWMECPTSNYELAVVFFNW